MGNRETHKCVLNRSNVPHSHIRGCPMSVKLGVLRQLQFVAAQTTTILLQYIGKDAHHRESGELLWAQKCELPRRQHPNPNTLRDAPTVRRGKTRAQKCVNDSCIIPQQYTRGCPMSVKLGGNISI